MANAKFDKKPGVIKKVGQVVGPKGGSVAMPPYGYGCLGNPMDKGRPAAIKKVIKTK